MESIALAVRCCLLDATDWSLVLWYSAGVILRRGVRRPNFEHPLVACSGQFGIHREALVVTTVMAGAPKTEMM